MRLLALISIDAVNTGLTPTDYKLLCNFAQQLVVSRKVEKLFADTNVPNVQLELSFGSKLG